MSGTQFNSRFWLVEIWNHLILPETRQSLAQFAFFRKKKNTECASISEKWNYYKIITKISLTLLCKSYTYKWFIRTMKEPILEKKWRPMGYQRISFHFTETYTSSSSSSFYRLLSHSIHRTRAPNLLQKSNIEFIYCREDCLSSPFPISCIYVRVYKDLFKVKIYCVLKFYSYYSLLTACSSQNVNKV